MTILDSVKFFGLLVLVTLLCAAGAAAAAGLVSWWRSLWQFCG